MSVRSRLRSSSAIRVGYRFVSAFVDPFRLLTAVRGIPRFAGDYVRYRRQANGESVPFRELMPSLHERRSAHEFDAHYVYVNWWVVARLEVTRPAMHADIASQIALPTMLAPRLPVVYVDYRPLPVHMKGLHSVAGDLVRLPFRDASVQSLSCLHVAEHVGLGRYGDPIDAGGTRKAAAELSRVLAPGGNLFFAVPVGRERTMFNAHRVHAATTIRDYFSSLTLTEFSGVDDAGRYRESMPLDALRDADYGCGFFWFTR